jgi:rhodanese-related sulfurtransferase
MYRGDLTPTQAYEKLMTSPGAVLIDVRTGPEWAFVGVPAVEGLLRISWQDYPQMRVNERFAEMVEHADLPLRRPLGGGRGSPDRRRLSERLECRAGLRRRPRQ